MECGVLWYLHVPKTGGTTMSHYFESQHELHGWQYANMWKLPVPRNERGELHDPVVWTGWNTSAQWQVALDALAADKPKLIVHSHHNMPGLSEPYMVEQVLRPMARSLKQKGCDLRFATMLREPVAEVTSLLLFGKTPKEKFTSKMLKWTDAMAKYVVWNYYAQWPEELSKEGAVTRAQGEELLAQSRAVLSNFSMIGRTEELDKFVRSINRALGWPLDQKAEPRLVGDERKIDFEYYAPTDEMTEAIKQSNGVDSQLYHTWCAQQEATPPAASFTAKAGGGFRLVNELGAARELAPQRRRRFKKVIS